MGHLIKEARGADLNRIDTTRPVEATGVKCAQTQRSSDLTNEVERNRRSHHDREEDA
jgi:hypothetical protein